MPNKFIWRPPNKIIWRPPNKIIWRPPNKIIWRPPYNIFITFCRMEIDEDTTIALYCYLGFTHKEILCFLALNHHIVISLLILKRGFLRKRDFFDVKVHRYIGNIWQVKAIWSVYHRMHRRIFLINVFRTSSNPKVVAGYFVEAV